VSYRRVSNRSLAAHRKGTRFHLGKEVALDAVYGSILRKADADQRVAGTVCTNASSKATEHLQS
jgi:hypothetical protein